MTLAASRSLVACVFPGQGSQRKGMGGDLFEKYGELCSVADEVLGFSIRELCLEDPRRQLRDTAYTQPAIFVANALAWLERTEREPPPAFLAGHSLGEYNALFAAGSFDFATGLRLVQRRGALMSRARAGGMAAVLGLSAQLVQEVLEEKASTVEVANFNLPTQLVLSGPKEELENLLPSLEAAGARKCILLNVSGAFHSKYMATAAAEFEVFLQAFTLAAPLIPVIANTSAQPYGAGSVERLLVEQIRTPVRWSETMDYLLQQGVSELQELGAGKVLTKLWATAAGEDRKNRARHDSPGGLAEDLGSEDFRRDYGLRLAYVAGASAPGVRTPEMVANLGRSGLLSFLDPVEREPGESSRALEETTRRLGSGAPCGVCLRPLPEQPGMEDRWVSAALSHGASFAEAVGYHHITPALVRFRFKGAYRDDGGRPVAPHHLLALVSHPSSASLFLNPAPEKTVSQLVDRGDLTAEEGEIARRLPMSSDLCAMASVGEGTDLATLLPSFQRLRDHCREEHRDGKRVRIGAGGAIGTPESVACAFFLGADFIHTGAINLAATDAGTPLAIKKVLAGLEPGNTTAAPAADGFSLGARVQVVKKGSFFAPRAQKLYEAFRFHGSLEELNPSLREKIEKTFLKRSISSILESFPKTGSEGRGPKQEMADVFTWYLRRSLQWAWEDHQEERLNFQIPCDESMAAFNLFAAGTDLEDPARRQASAMAEALMKEAARYLRER